MTMKHGPVFLALLVAIALPVGTAAQPRLDPAGIDGTLLLGGSAKLSDTVLDRFAELAGGRKARLVVLTGKKEAAAPDPLLVPWKNREVESVVASSFRDAADMPDKNALAVLSQATGVWIDRDSTTLILAISDNVPLLNGLRALLRRGGIIGTSGEGSGALGRLFLPARRDIESGLAWLPETVVLTQFSSSSDEPHLFRTLEKHPRLVGLGIGIAEDAALQVRGRQLRVVGDGAVTLCLARTPTREPKTLTLKGKEEADLTALLRAGRARAAAPFPPMEAPIPEVAGGALVIVGGGGMPAEVTKKFIDLAGGPEALIVVLPTASPDPVPLAEGEFLKRAGAKNIKVLPGRKLADVDGPESLAALEKAGGIWFGGGRQWRFVDAYEGTKALELMHGVLKRGGVIGGSSAGATIQGDYLCRGSPFGNLEIMYEGYERGLAFLPCVAIDQHFAQRKRFADMTQLMKTYPQLLGIGIDETTALIVKGHVAEVMGKNQVHFYNGRRPVADGQPDHESVKAGERYDLKARQVLAGKD